jgi:tRNA pseudouridine55 synthase
VDGVLVIDKPAGPTSHDVVARVRRALGIDRVGHTGTLDPMATGVLPLVLGRATRLARFLAATEKEYEATVALGRETDTDDATAPQEDAGACAAAVPAGAAAACWPGRGAAFADAGPRQGPALEDLAIRAALARWTGTYEQTPPAYSAKKIGGVRAYELARRGRAVSPKPARVTVRRLELVGFDPGAGRVRLRVLCSAGFYVRALARDLGRDLGTGGHLVALRRTRSGRFGVDAAVPLEVVEGEGRDAGRRVTAMDALLDDLPALVLGGAGVRRAAHGQDIGDGDLASPGGIGALGAAACRLLDGSGRLVAVAEASPRPGFLHPAVVVV